MLPASITAVNEGVCLHTHGCFDVQVRQLQNRGILAIALRGNYNSLQLLAAQTPGSNITVISTVIIKIMLCNANTSRMTTKMQNDHHLQQIKGIKNKQNSLVLTFFHSRTSNKCLHKYTQVEFTNQCTLQWQESKTPQ